MGSMASEDGAAWRKTSTALSRKDPGEKLRIFFVENPDGPGLEELLTTFKL